MQVGDRLDVIVTDRDFARSKGLGQLLTGELVHETDQAYKVRVATILRPPPADGEVVPCRLCDRPLTEPASVSIGYGPDCMVRIGLTNKFVRDLARPLTRDEQRAAMRSILQVVWLPKAKVEVMPQGTSALRELELKKQQKRQQPRPVMPNMAAIADAYPSDPLPSVLLALDKDLRGYQWRDVRFALDKRNSYNGSEPGAGKTPVGGVFLIEAMRRLREAGRDAPGLILCPPVMLLVWEQWFKEWTQGYRVQILKGYTARIDPKADIYLVAYSALASGWEQLTDGKGTPLWHEVEQKDGTLKRKPVVDPDRVRLSDTARGLVDLMPGAAVCDEFHYCKGWSNQRTQAALQLLQPTEYLLAMSGTMIMNRPQEAGPQLEALGYLDSVFGGRENYEVRWCGKTLKKMRVTGKNGRKVTKRVWDFEKPTGETLVDLHEKLKGFYVRHKKVDVAPELPPLELARVPVELGNRAEYERLEAEVAELPPMARLGMLGKLRQLCGIGKIPSAIEWVENFLECDEKLVVFAYHQAVQQALIEHFAKQWKDREPLHILASDSMKDRQKAITAFQSDPSQLLIVCSLGAAREGVTLTAASNLLMIELDWVPGVLTQAWNRIHRHGATGDRITVWTTFAPESIDQTMTEKLVTKRLVTGEVLDGEGEVLDEKEVQASALRDLMVRVSRRKKKAKVA
jgi:SWI/SNF-related matrix-associated actin-dependent regulator 1 of chromatin subfamily A